jgi:hypothetical protein
VRVDLRPPGIAVRRPTNSTLAQDRKDREARPECPRHGRNDSRLASLYQDTLDAPIPQDMIHLLEKLKAAYRER